MIVPIRCQCSLVSLYFLTFVVSLCHVQAQPVPVNERIVEAIAKSRQRQNPSEAIGPLNEALAISASASDSLRAVLFLEIGINHGRIFANDSALFYLQKSSAIARNRDWPLLKAELFNYKGNLYRNQSLNERALANYDSGLHFLEALKTRDRFVAECKILGNIGGIHYDLEEYAKALEFAEKSKAVVVKNNITEWMNYTYIMVAFAARALGQNAKALENNQLALQAMLADKDSSYLHHTYYNIGSLQQLEGDFTNAVANFEKALMIAEKFKEEEVSVSCLIAKAQILLEQRKYALALPISEEALERSKPKGFLPKIIESLDIQYKLFKAQNSWREAALAQEQYIVFKDSLFNVQSKEKLATIETRYETEKKEQQIRDLEQANIIKDLEATTARQWQIGLVVFLVFLSVVVGILYNRYQLKQRTAKALDEKNGELQKLNGFKDRMFAVISHDLRNPVDAFSTIIESLNHNLQHASREELKEFLESTLKSARDLKSLLNNLLEWSLVQIGKLPFNPVSVSIHEVVAESTSHLEVMTMSKNIKIHNGVDLNQRVLADKGMLTIVLRNLLSNALKFSPEGKTVELSAQRSNGSVIIAVRDEGMGMTAEEASRLFKMEENTRSIGSSPEKGAGIGLLLCKELVDKNRGTISVQSTPGVGSTFYLALPSP